MKYFEIDFKIMSPAEQKQDACDLLAAFLGEIGFETFDETETGLLAYIQQQMFDEGLLQTTVDDFPMDDVRIDYSIKEAEYRDWNETWENEGFDPIVINDILTIHDGRHLPAEATDIMIEIDAKMAFGTGTHETTRMIVAQLVGSELNGKSVLDCGCGTGILGIAALKLGAGNVVGYDIDEWSVDNSRHNAIINRVEDCFESHLGDSSVIDTLDSEFDIVLANINRNILLNDMPQFVKAMTKGSKLVLSGFYTEDAALLVDKAASLGLVCENTLSDNNWACLVFRGV